MAERHRVLAREQREFDAQERRYEDRRKAVSDFLVLPAPYSYLGGRDDRRSNDGE